MSTPACEVSWCNSGHTTPVHSCFELRTPLVGLLQTPYRPRPILVIGDVDIGTDQAEPMAVLMEQVGRKDIAVAIRRLMTHLDEASP